jgi:hypothetical protein
MRSAKKALFILVIPLTCLKISFCPAIAPDDSSPPKIPSADGITNTLTTPAIKEIRMGDLKVEFERTTLPDVVRRLGVGKIQHRGDASESEYWLCFTGASTAGDRRIWVLSGELGGAQHFVDSIIVTKMIKKASPSDACPQLPGQFRELSLDGAPWVGTKAEYIEKSLGQPSLKRNDWLFYSYNGKVPNSDFEESALLGLRVVNGEVITLVASKITTN